MSSDFKELHDVFFGNMTGGMYGWLGERLGVSVASLEALEVGWVPVVQFKKAKSFDGWFTTPMRDAGGKVTGFALRNQQDAKVLYPGSKPGCFYVVNPDHMEGSGGYSGGAHNWVRTVDIRRPCPVCGKPDGCLISNEDISNPRAVICRTKKTQRKMKLGWLHILKAEGNLMNTRLLPGEGPVFSVEGASDVSALFDMGLVGVGRPSNLGGIDIAADLIRGRETYVLGENDQKSDGKWPGRDGAIASLETFKRNTRHVRMAMPPVGIKDLRAWKVRHGLTKEGLLGHFETHGTERVDHLVLPDSKPISVVRGFMSDLFIVNKVCHLRLNGDNWYLYDSVQGKYELTKDAQIVSEFYRWSADKQYTVETAKGSSLEPLVATSGMWTNIKQAGNADLLIRSDPPSWINGVSGPPAADLIVFNNGIINVPKFLDGQADYMYETTPNFFNTTALPFSFDPTAECPSWLRFVESSLGDEPEKIELLQEWLGYCMTPDTSMQKLMYLRGVSGSGKSRVMEVLEALVGRPQSATTTFSDLAGQFGLSPLVGKLTCLIWDARTPRGSDTMRGLEVLLNLSGGDSVQVNRKFKDQLEGTALTARVTIASNVFIDVPDHSGAMLRRLNVVQFQRTFRDNPDTDLPRRLRMEIPGIAIWALEGLRRLRLNGEFTEPESSKHAKEEWRISTNPLVSFLDETTVMKPDGFVTRDELFDMWRMWASNKSGLANLNHGAFVKQILASAPHVVSGVADVAVGTGKVSGYIGIDIEPGAARRYLQRP